QNCEANDLAFERRKDDSIHESHPLSPDQQAVLDKLLVEFEGILASFSGEVGHITTEEFTIELTDKVPITLRPYKCSVKEQEIIDRHIKVLLEQGLIEKSTSPYSFPVVLAMKRDADGTMKLDRLCIDYRRINLVTVPQTFPMPRIGDIEDRLFDAKFFTTLDVSAGFHHISIKPEDRKRTAFVTCNDQYQWTRIPFGMRNSGIVFQRVLYHILLKHNLTRFSTNYVDDIVIFSRSFEDHLQHIRSVLEAMQIENVKLKKAKCQFAKASVTYLGHFISYNRIQPLNSNTQAILEFPAPTNVKALRGFLGKVNYYYRFIPDRSK